MVTTGGTSLKDDILRLYSDGNNNRVHFPCDKGNGYLK